MFGYQRDEFHVGILSYLFDELRLEHSFVEVFFLLLLVSFELFLFSLLLFLGSNEFSRLFVKLGARATESLIFFEILDFV